jgi:predicted  nucleic acid-binding Zn-ribbon protein
MKLSHMIIFCTIFLLVILGTAIVSSYKVNDGIYQRAEAYEKIQDSLRFEREIREKFLQAAQVEIDILKRTVAASHHRMDSLENQYRKNQAWYQREISRYNNMTAKELEDEAENIYRNFTAAK